MFKPITDLTDAVSQEAKRPSLNIERAKFVFQALHGSYGNVFLSKFATGELVDGEDQGTVGAMRMWAGGLRGYDDLTIRAALNQCLKLHPEFPPNLAQFQLICEARRPREAYRAEAQAPAIGMSPELVAKRKQERQERLARARGLMLSRASAHGLDGLKQAIADAAKTAGGDEVAELLRLDRLLTAKGAAHV